MTTAILRDKMVAKIAVEINGMLNAWETGKLPSPDQRDYVLAARDVLGLKGSMPDVTVEFYADILFDDCGEKYVTVEDIATFLFDSLTAE